MNKAIHLIKIPNSMLELSVGVSYLKDNAKIIKEVGNSISSFLKHNNLFMSRDNSLK